MSEATDDALLVEFFEKPGGIYACEVVRTGSGVAFVFSAETAAEARRYALMAYCDEMERRERDGGEG